VKRPKFLDQRWVPPVVSLLICGLVFLSFTILREAGALQRFEFELYDAMMRWRWHGEPAASDVVVIGIDDADMTRMRRTTPSDHELALLIGNLQGFGVRAVGLDLIRDMDVLDPTVDTEEVRGPAELADVLARAPRNVVAITMLPGNGVEIRAPAGMTIESGQLALAEVAEDFDGVVRRGLISRYSDTFPDTTGDGKADPAASLAFRLAELALDSEGIVPKNDPADPETIVLGKGTFAPLDPDSGGYVGAEEVGHMFLLDFAGGKIKTFNFTDATSGRLLRSDVEGKVVFIGKRSHLDKDYFNTPMGRDQYGVDIHARIVDQFLRAARHGDRPPRVWSRGSESGWILLWTLLGGLGGYLVRQPLRFAALIVGGVLAMPVVGFVAFNMGWWIPVVPASLGWFTAAAFVTSYAAYRERLTRSTVETVLSKHVDPGVVRHLMKNANSFLSGGRLLPQKLTATVLFTDLHGFSKLARELGPEVLMPWLNEYMDVMSKLVADHGGVVNKYIGDSIMAVFGVPVPRVTRAEIAKDAADAVRCAVDMRNQLMILNARWAGNGQPLGEMRVGIYTGELMAGSLGSAARMEYTVLGDTVNTASRLESLKLEANADGSVQAMMDHPEVSANCCRILVGQPTFALIDGQFRTKRIGELSLKGIAPLEVYAVLGSVQAGAPRASAGVSTPV
jgi:adenylate cyclase